MGDEFHFPKVVVHEISQEEGHKYRKTLTAPVCDFCFDERAKWSYECNDFVLDTNAGVWASSNGWAVCDQCSELIERKLWNDLIARVLRSWAALGSAIDQPKIEDAGSIVFTFADEYTPGRIAFG